MAITDWPEGERPREKLLDKGASALSDAELLAIFLRTGVPGRSAVDLGRDLIGRFETLQQLFAASEEDFCEIKGLGRAKYVQLRAVHELVSRSLKEQMKEGVNLSSPKTVRDFLRIKLQGLDYEVFAALYLDAQNRVIGYEELFRGTLTQTSVYPREVVKNALAANAAAIIFAHNHPSGIAEPSRSDELLTHTLRQALTLVDIKVLDHFVIGAGCSVSFAERGLL